MLWSYSPATILSFAGILRLPWKSIEKVWTASGIYTHSPSKGWRNSFYCLKPGMEPASTHNFPPLLWALRQLAMLLSDRSMVRHHWSTDVVSYKDHRLLRTRSLFLNQVSSAGEGNIPLKPPGHNPIYQSWTYLLWARGSLSLTVSYTTRLWW